jgi:tricorn protease
MKNTITSFPGKLFPFFFLLFLVALVAIPSLKGQIAVRKNQKELSEAPSQGFEGYYQQPTLHGETIVFVAEGDLWKVPSRGGLAQRLTTHAGEESYPRISPDGNTIAFSATYEGPTEVYTMPVNGGLPERWTYQASPSFVNTWTAAGELVYATRHFSTLPDYQLVKIDPEAKTHTRLPLHQASEGTFSADGKSVFFVRPAYHGNVTKRYKGGTARQIWRFTEGSPEAVKLTTDYAGESHHPMWWDDRVYFISDRDGTMNIWSMNDNGGDLKQHTRHKDFDVRYASIHDGKIVYRWKADIWLYDIPGAESKMVPIRLASDLDQLRERWVDKPMDYLTSSSLHPGGEKIVLTARGRVFVAPVKEGRLVQLSRKEGVRYRDAVFSADGENIIVLTDESGEFEFIEIPASGIGEHKFLTNDGTTIRYKAQPSPDGKWLAYSDLKNHWWLLNTETKEQKKFSLNNNWGSSRIAWAPDSQWLAYVQSANNSFQQIHVYHIESGEQFPLTTDRANSFDPVWSPDGKWIYFLSDRNFQSLVGSPWGSRQPEPYFDRKMKIYQVALEKGTRSPFSPENELTVVDKEEKEEKDEKDNDEKVTVTIDREGIQRRLLEVPIPPGNYGTLRGNKKALYFTNKETGLEAKTHLMVLPISNEKPEAKEMIGEVRSYDLSADGKKLMVRKGQSFSVVNAGTGPVKDLKDSKVDLSNWAFSLNVREDWRQLFKDAWRMERDYFYDPGMHGLDWDAMYEKYLPLVDRVTTRSELSDLIGRFVGELSALHTSVRGGDVRRGEDQIRVASLGARLQRAEEKGGYLIDYIYQADPDYPDERSPLDHPELGVSVGDVIEQVNGVSTLSVPHIGALLRNQAGEQVRLGIRSAQSGEVGDIIIEPLSSDYSLRYRDWEYSRRLEVEEKSSARIGYVHLQAMGSRDISQWYREFYPVFNRQGLIIDARHNRGGNIESFILEKLMRQAWMYWQTREERPIWNMQYAFRGHMVVLVDENTASDGEAFADGFRRLGLGPVIGKRTWGGEIWLSSANRLSDGGLARAPMMGVYGPEGEWLVEGHGVVPDIEVDNLPHATFKGKDAQLDAAIQYLLQEIEKDPREVPPPPDFPDKSFGNN